MLALTLHCDYSVQFFVFCRKLGEAGKIGQNGQEKPYKQPYKFMRIFVRSAFSSQNKRKNGYKNA